MGHINRLDTCRYTSIMENHVLLSCCLSPVHVHGHMYTPVHVHVHAQVVASIEKLLLWCGYWIGLGILSSVGLGTGLHTFLLYLVSYMYICTVHIQFSKCSTVYAEIFMGEIFCVLNFRGVKFSWLKSPTKIGCHKNFATLTVCSMDRWLLSSEKSYACMDTTFTTTYGKLLLEKRWFA